MEQAKQETHATLTVGRRVRWARRQAGFTQDELAAAMGTTRQTVIRWEKDRNLPNARYRVLLGIATGQHPDFFVDETRSARIEDEDDEAMRRRARELVSPFQAGNGRSAAGGVQAEDRARSDGRG